MYRLLILFLSIIAAFPLHSFGDSGTTLISGKAVDSLSRKGVPFVTVTVQNSQSKVLKRLASDASGSFEFSLKEDLKGEVVISAIGYKPATVKFSAGSKPKENLGAIVMSESSAKIEQVVVQAQKQLVKVDADKISYNTEADPESQTTNALDMLRKVPLLTVDGEDNITLKGSSSFKILVNGKESTLMSNNAKDVLRGMSASSIKNVEVITNPSSKYSAEGVGGIINIITAKKTLEGVMGSVSLRADNIGGFGGNVYTSAKIEKLSFSFNYGPNYQKQKKTTVNTWSENFGNPTERIIDTKLAADGDLLNSFGSGEMSYEIDSLNLISLSFLRYGGIWKNDIDGSTSVFDDQNKLYQQFTQTTYLKKSFGSLTGNLDYQRSFKKPDKLFTVSYKLEYNPTGVDYEYNVKGITSYPNSQKLSNNDAASYENTFQIDFVNPFIEKHLLEVGAKYIIRTNPSKTYIYNDIVNGRWEEDPNSYGDLDYTQNIVAAYVGYLFKVNKISMKTGFRLEGAYTDADSKQGITTTNFSNKQTNIIPYLTFTYKLKESSSIKLSYTQRLQRPSIWYLNPYVDDSQPKALSYGNPNLETEKVHSFDLSYSYFGSKANIELSLFTQLNSNAIQRISFFDSNKFFVSTYENSGINNTFGSNFYGSYRLTPSVSFDFDGSVTYSVMERNLLGSENLRKVGWMYNGSGSFRWTIIPGLMFAGYAGGSSGWLQLQGKYRGSCYHGFSLRKDLLNKKLNVSVSLKSPFQKYQTWTSDLRDDSFKQHIEYRSLSRTISLGISYSFGEMGTTVKKAQRGINNDDVKSGGGNGGGGK